MTRFSRFEALELARERLEFAPALARKLRERTRKTRERTQKILERTRKNPRKNAKERATHVNICAKHVKMCAKPAKYRKGRQNPQKIHKITRKGRLPKHGRQTARNQKYNENERPTQESKPPETNKNRQAKGIQNATGEQKNEAGSMQSSQFKVGCSPPFELSDASASTLETFQQRNLLKKAKAKT